VSSVGSVIERVRVTDVWSGEDMGEARQYLRSVICRLGQRACGIVLQFTVYAMSFQLNSCFSFRDFL
jgi:hypothetical protein